MWSFFSLSRSSPSPAFSSSRSRVYLARFQYRIMALSSTLSSPVSLYVDTHTHLDQILAKYTRSIDDLPTMREEIVSTAKQFPRKKPPSGNTHHTPIVDFKFCIHVCCDLGSFEQSDILAERGVNDERWIYLAYGIHPHNANTYNEEVENRLLERMSHCTTVAWGECGLDYHYNYSTPQQQKDAFISQIKAAVSINKPIVIHTREAEEDTIQIMRSFVPKDHFVHLHCFTSSVEMAETLLSEYPNLYIGFTGVITFKTAESAREVVKVTPMDRILLETDGPFMAPVPFRGRPCHSGHIPWTAQKIAEVKGNVTVAEVIAQTTLNAHRMYQIP